MLARRAVAPRGRPAMPLGTDPMTRQPDSDTSTASDTTATGDDLRVIRGVGPDTAQRLAELGVGSVAALAAADPAEIVNRATGWPSRPGRDRVGDWINQARRLVDDTGPAPAVLPRAHPQRPHPAGIRSARTRYSFTLQVQINHSGSGAAIATRVTEVDESEAWSGWEPERLARFVAIHSGLAGPDTPPTRAAVPGPAPQPTTTTPAPPTPLPAPSAPTPTPVPKPGAAAVLGYGILQSRSLVTGGRTVRVILRLGEGDLAATSTTGVRTLEWELVSGAAAGRADQQLTRGRRHVQGGEPVVEAIEVRLPTQPRQARLGAVVRSVGTGQPPAVAHILSDSTLEVIDPT